jgi:hypothetical protein
MLMNGKWLADWHPVQAKDEEGRFVRADLIVPQLDHEGRIGRSNGDRRVQG